VTPTILDRVQDGQGKTIFVNGDKTCEVCQQEEFSGGPPPEMPDEREVVIDPVTAYQVTFMLKGVVDNGTGFRVRRLQRPMAGKTGTTNDLTNLYGFHGSSTERPAKSAFPYS